MWSCRLATRYTKFWKYDVLLIQIFGGEHQISKLKHGHSMFENVAHHKSTDQQESVYICLVIVDGTMHI